MNFLVRYRGVFRGGVILWFLVRIDVSFQFLIQRGIVRQGVVSSSKEACIFLLEDILLSCRRTAVSFAVPRRITHLQHIVFFTGVSYAGGSMPLLSKRRLLHHMPSI